MITTTGVPGQRQGVLFYGADNSGFTPPPWGVGSTSYRCVASPTKRLRSMGSGGIPGQCNGTYWVSWDGFQAANPTALGNPWMVGDSVFVQSWYRDSLAAKGSNLSNAVELSYVLGSPPPMPCASTLPGMVAIPAGTFHMGSTGGGPYFAFGPVHQVTISYCFWMGETEVTQAQYSALMGTNPSWFQGANLPVEQVDWADAQAYCALLTVQQSALGNIPAGYHYRLPTEAEWEYACRSTTTTEFNVGANLLCSEAQIDGHLQSNSCCAPGCAYVLTAPVGTYAPNAWGLYDMHGNVFEWCLDEYKDYSLSAPATDPFVNIGTSDDRILRGGAWGYVAEFATSAFRTSYPPPTQSSLFGFRVVLAPILVP
ncbi:MAG: SUMF1/EgtB/PvdO family nonheme iron enzyme [Planctomycetes bacterium]|nr:SUMF1/EgtB/PvdO family nonheme iron enzyme [Planctomycetota bacterium]